MRPARGGAVLAVVLISATAFGCSAGSGSEQSVLRQFFTASRLRDSAALGSFASARFDPATDGIVTTFTITDVGPERRTPLNLKESAKAHEDAKAADAEFTRRRKAYEDENVEAIRRVLKAERENATVRGKDAQVQAAWDRFREESVALLKRVSDARSRLAAETAIAELSAAEPGTPIDVTKYDGELGSKDVTVRAPVNMPNGQTSTTTLIVTLQRAELKGETAITGRWVVANVRATSRPAVESSEFLTIERALQKLQLGKIAFNVPIEMTLDETYRIHLLLSKSLPEQELQAQLHEYLGSSTASGTKDVNTRERIETAAVKIGPRMEAIVTGQNFEITEVTPQEQPVSREETTEWQWDVKPRKPGTQELHFTINVILLVNKATMRRAINTFDRRIDVKVTTGQWLTALIGEHWGWVLITTLLLPFVGWLVGRGMKSAEAQ